MPTGEHAGKVMLVRPSSRGKIKASRMSSSLLCLTFNRLWVTALNALEEAGLTDFAMQHDDILAPAGWADVLIDEREAHGAAICSAVVPIKDERGLTSTGVRNSETGDTRRLTMAEIFQLPETFCLADVHALGITSGGPIEHDLLAVNTGLWVCRLTDSWPDHFPGFRMTDGIIRHPDGTRQAGVVPEDWQFSEWLWQRGLKTVATRKVTLAHLENPLNPNGRQFRNDHVWGTWTTDLGEFPMGAQ